MKKWEREGGGKLEMGERKQMQEEEGEEENE